MDITKTIAELKRIPNFAENTGMILIHNGVVRAWSRKDRATVTKIRIKPDNEKFQSICQEMEQMPGIFKIIAEVAEGDFFPGDDLLFLIVAGDIRENVKDCLSKLLDRIKAEAVIKEEFLD